LSETHSDPTIRIAIPDDAAALADFAERSFRDTFAPDNTAADMNLYVASAFGTDRQRSELQDSRGVVLLMETGGSIAGYAQLHQSPAPREIGALLSIELQRFYVARKFHGRGLAQRLMQSAIDTAAERGALTIWLAVWERNPRATAFYRKHGFADVGSQPFILGEDRQTDRIMCRSTVR
jgi:diamine N-acetyltransferase